MKEHAKHIISIAIVVATTLAILIGYSQFLRYEEAKNPSTGDSSSCARGC